MYLFVERFFEGSRIELALYLRSANFIVHGIFLYL